MENYHLPFKTGMDWLRGACVVVKRAPATVFGILGCYVLALFVANLPSELLGLSWLGAILSSLVTPFGALAFAACGRELARGCPPTLFSCFGEGWNDMETRNKLVLLGLIYGLCVIVIGLIVSLLTSGDIAQWKNAQGQIDPQSVLSHIPWLGFIVGAVLYAMLLGITCFSPMLIAWKKQPIGKAFFFSLVVCFRNIGAIVCLGLLLFLLASGGAVAFGALGDLGDLGQILVILWALFVTGLSYSALYPMWRSIFESEVPPLR